MKTRKLRIKRKVVVKSRKKGKLNRKISNRRKQRKSMMRRRTQQNKYRRHNLKKRFSRKMSEGGAGKNLRDAKFGRLEPPPPTKTEIARGFVSSLVSSVSGRWKSYYFKETDDGKNWERTNETVLDGEKEVLGTGDDKDKGYFLDQSVPFSLVDIKTFYKHYKMYETPFAIYKNERNLFYIIWEDSNHYLQRFSFRSPEINYISYDEDTVYISRNNGADKLVPHKIVRLKDKDTAIKFIEWINTSTPSSAPSDRPPPASPESDSPPASPESDSPEGEGEDGED